MHSVFITIALLPAIVAIVVVLSSLAFVFIHELVTLNGTRCAMAMDASQCWLDHRLLLVPCEQVGLTGYRSLNIQEAKELRYALAQEAKTLPRHVAYLKPWQAPINAKETSR